jgi:hypothetical protein
MTHVYYRARFPWRSRAVVNGRLTSRPSSVPLGVVIITWHYAAAKLGKATTNRSAASPPEFFPTVNWVTLEPLILMEAGRMI